MKVATANAAMEVARAGHPEEARFEPVAVKNKPQPKSVPPSQEAKYQLKSKESAICHKRISLNEDVWKSVLGFETNAFFEFIDPKQQIAFVEFKTAQLGTHFYTPPVAAVASFVCIAYWAVALHCRPNFLSALGATITLCVTLPLLTILTIAKQSRAKTTAQIRGLYDNTFMLFMCFSIGIAILYRVRNGQCDSHIPFHETWTCAPTAKFHNLSPDMPMLLAFVPLLCSFTLPAISSQGLLLVYTWIILVFAIADYTLYSQYAPTWQLVLLVVIGILHCIKSWTQMQLFLFFVRIDDLQRLRDEDAERQTSEQRKLIGKLAHDIRTPLVAFDYGLDAIQHRLEQLRDDVTADSKCLSSFYNAVAPVVSRSSPDDRLRASCAVAQRNVLASFDALEGLQQSHEQLMMMVNRYLDYNKLNLGVALVPTYAPASVAAMVEAIVQYARRALDSDDVRVELATGLGVVVTDPGWLHDNLLCLLSNAIRFSDPQQPVIVRVERASSYGDSGTATNSDGTPTSLTSSHDSFSASYATGAADSAVNMLRFEVEDFGVGVSVENLSRLFDVPDSSDERSVGGAGLGLHCLAQRIKGLRGEFGVRRKPRQQVAAENSGSQGPPQGGSAFWFSLPLVPTAPLSAAEEELIRRPTRRSSTATAIASCRTQAESVATNKGLNTDSALPVSESTVCSTQDSSTISRDAYDAQPLPLASEGAPQEPRDRPMRVLVVDDSPLILKMLKMMFVGKGHDVVTTPSAIEGLVLLRESFVRFLDCVERGQPRSVWAQFDAVLIDIQMPIMDGLEMMRQYEALRAELAYLTDRGLPWPVIVAMSANTDHDTMRDAYAVGAHHFLRKPFDLDTFLAVCASQRESPGLEPTPT